MTTIIVKDEAVSADLKDKTVIGFLLDETGSMGGLKKETISSFNEYVQSVKDEIKDVVMTLTKFNSLKIEIIYNLRQLKNVPSLDEKSYEPNALTPLYDAIGQTIREMEPHMKECKKALFIIQTDGYENASKEYSLDAIKKLIKEKEKEGWTFVFLGANLDDHTSNAGDLGIHNTLYYLQGKTRGSFRQLGESTVSFCRSDNKETDNFF